MCEVGFACLDVDTETGLIDALQGLEVARRVTLLVHFRQLFHTFGVSHLLFGEEVGATTRHVLCRLGWRVLHSLAERVLTGLWVHA